MKKAKAKDLREFENIIGILESRTPEYWKREREETVEIPKGTRGTSEFRNFDRYSAQLDSGITIVLEEEVFQIGDLTPEGARYKYPSPETNPPLTTYRMTVSIYGRMIRKFESEYFEPFISSSIEILRGYNSQRH